jgi:hypothetical protein
MRYKATYLTVEAQAMYKQPTHTTMSSILEKSHADMTANGNEHLLPGKNAPDFQA